MRATAIDRRLEKLTLKLRPNGVREFTLEELCRHWWRIDKRGFLAYMKKEFHGLQVFADMFEREDVERADRAARERRRAR